MFDPAHSHTTHLCCGEFYRRWHFPVCILGRQNYLQVTHINYQVARSFCQWSLRT